MISIDEKKKKQLRFYSRVSMISIVSLLGGYFVLYCWAYVKDTLGNGPGLLLLAQFFLPLISLTLIIFCVGQFIQYVLSDKDQPGKLLRHGDKILYYSAAMIVFTYVLSLIRASFPDFKTSAGCLFLTVWVLSAAAKVVLLVVLARVFRRVMPMIEESKTMV